MTPQGSWEVRLEGERRHLLKVEFKVAVKTTPEGKQIQFAIPQAPSTFIELQVAEPVTEASLGSGEPIGKEPLAVGKGTRLSAHISPRPQLTVEWSDGASSGPGRHRCWPSLARWPSTPIPKQSPRDRRSWSDASGGCP